LGAAWSARATEVARVSAVASDALADESGGVTEADVVAVVSETTSPGSESGTSRAAVVAATAALEDAVSVGSVGAVEVGGGLKKCVEL
jgi:hypothetical protein